MKRTFRTFRQTLLATFLLLTGVCLNAQVTVGGDTAPNPFSILEISTANVKGGLRLPHLSNGERDILSATTAFQTAKNRPGGAALGLTIYNTDTNCIEYWDGNKWVSLCLGTAEISFIDDNNLPVDPTQPSFPAAGGDKGPFTPVDIPNCTTENPPFAFALITGGEYTFINIIDASTGKFTIYMEPNPMAKERSAIMRITNNCSGEYKEFIFSQDGDAADCGTTTSLPEIKSNSGTEICQNGSILLYLNGYPTTGTFIWTLAGKEVGRGNFLSVTEPGKYTVYGDKIGCANEASITLTRGGTPAPSSVDFIVIGNNGVACGINGTVELIVTNTTGNIVWYRDGKKAPETGRKINAGAGQWFAIVEDGSCNSLPSKAVNVIANTDATSLAEPVMKVNDVIVNTALPLNLCRGGSMYLQVVSPEANVRYTWYINNDEIGNGANLYWSVPILDQFVLRVRATGTGCAIEALVEANIGTVDAPVAPIIVVNTDNALCGGEATLTATNSPGATSYRWFKNGIEITGQTANTLTVNEVGSYTASALVSGCASNVSGPRTIIASDFATVSWVSNPATANIGDTKTYGVSINFVQSAAYTWSVVPTSAGTITNGQGTSAVTVRFTEVNNNVKIKCIATNACGTAGGSPLEQTVDVTNACADARILGTSKLNVITKVNQAIPMSVTASGTNPITYQWYSPTVSGANKIAGATSATYTYNTGNTVGDIDFYCVATAASPCDLTADTSPKFTVTVGNNPEVIPTGTGNFNGKTCFDIAVTPGNSNSCGALNGRESQKTDFAIRTPQNVVTTKTGPYSGVQIYTFKPSGTVSKVRFDYVDVSGNVIEDVIPTNNYNTMTGITGECTVTVEFNPKLNDLLIGTTRQTGYKVELYAIYNDNAAGTGNERKLKLTLNLQDCACCGAATAEGGWLNFMCHNLGADQSLDPFTFVVGSPDGTGGTLGYLYQWGRPAVVDGIDGGYQKRTSSVTDQLANNIYGTVPAFVRDKYISNSIISQGYQWYSGLGGGPYGWDEPSDNVKSIVDPCPEGWKVPSRAQWVSVLSANTRTFVNDGYKIGDAMFLPLAGYRSVLGLYPGGVVAEVRTVGWYWSSTATSSGAYSVLMYKNNDIRPQQDSKRSTAMSVRCVQDN